MCFRSRTAVVFVIFVAVLVGEHRGNQNCVAEARNRMQVPKALQNVLLLATDAGRVCDGILLLYCGATCGDTETEARIQSKRDRMAWVSTPHRLHPLRLCPKALDA